jgi:NADH dehydrogenase FAD-containing subunit
LIRNAAQFTRCGVELVVIAPENFWYSGLATGVVGGDYAPRAHEVKITPLLKGRGIFIRDTAVKVDTASRQVILARGEPVPYDVLSLNLGSFSPWLHGATERVFQIKPLQELVRLRAALQKAMAAGERPRVIVAGGGASGCEIAANIRALLGDGKGEVIVLARGERLVPIFATRVAAVLHQWMRSHGVEVRLETDLERVQESLAITRAGESLRFDFLVNAIGLHPPELLSRSSLPLSPRGELIIDEQLRSIGNSRIFAVGDCAALQGHDLAKVGVYAIRQAPVLLQNVRASITGEPLQRFRPQRSFLLILNLGNRTALAVWRQWWWLGRAAFLLKDGIDRQFLRRSRSTID